MVLSSISFRLILILKKLHERKALRIFSNAIADSCDIFVDILTLIKKTLGDAVFVARDSFDFGFLSTIYERLIKV